MEITVEKMQALQSPEGLKAIAVLVSSITWPLIAVAVLLFFQAEVRGLMQRTTEGEFGGVLKFKAQAVKELREELKKSASDTSNAPTRQALPTPTQIAAGQKVEAIASKAGTAIVQNEAAQLAREYESVRASMPPGDARTRQMEIIVAKMRTIGKAIFPDRYGLSASTSPGDRLLAIAALEVEPDLEFLHWLGERVMTEKPFVGYHALVALNVAAESKNARFFAKDFRHVVEQIDKNEFTFSNDTDRQMMFNRFKTAVASL